MVGGPPLTATRSRSLAEVEQSVATRDTGFRFWRAEWFLFLLFIAPNVLLFGVFTYWPMVQNAYLSTVRWDMMAPVKINVGLDNYRYLVENGVFGRVLLNTLIFTVGSVGISLVLGLAAALLLNQPLNARRTRPIEACLPGWDQMVLPRFAVRLAASPITPRHDVGSECGQDRRRMENDSLTPVQEESGQPRLGPHSPRDDRCRQPRG